jgi:hypothetical protein
MNRLNAAMFMVDGAEGLEFAGAAKYLECPRHTPTEVRL